MNSLAGYLVLASLACVGETAGSHPAQAEIVGVCTSTEFREAFLDGQQDASFDELRPSQALVEAGDRFLSCLKTVAKTGGTSFGISGCAEESCQTWALWAIRLIGNANARTFLVDYLGTSTSPRALIAAIQAVGSLGEASARPALRRLVENKDPEIRLRSIIALGAIRNRDDLTTMLEATKTLPEALTAGAVDGFRLLGAETAIVPLRQIADRIKDSAAKSRLLRQIDSWSAAVTSNERTLSTLRFGRDWELIKTLQGLQEPVGADVREAVLALLDHEDAHIRAESVIATAKCRRQSDFDRLIQVTLALPEPYVPIAVRGLELLNDPRAIGPLRSYAEQMTNPSRKQALLGVIERLKRGSVPTSVNQQIPATSD